MITTLRELAEKASPGPWTVHVEPVFSPFMACTELSRLANGTILFSGTLPMLVDANGMCPAVTGCGPTSDANAAYIAAANPQAILELLDRCEKLEAEAARYRWLRNEDACGDADMGAYRRAWDNHKREWLVGEELDAAIDTARAALSQIPQGD
jgi:hypothetical protein